MTQKSLKGFHIPNYFKYGVLDCSCQDLTSLEGCPEGVIYLDCCGNKLTSLEGCPKSLIRLKCHFNNLTSLTGCPEGLILLDCWNTKLTSLKGCPNSLTKLYCGDNKLTSLEGCPNSLTTLYCLGNPLYTEYKNKSLKQIHQINYIKKLKRGIDIVNNIIREKAALKIQKTWDNYWYKPNKDGESRAAKRGYTEFNNFLLQF